MNERLAKTDTIVAIYVLVAFIMLIVSLPAAILDVFMAFNIAIAFTILFACMFIKEVLHGLTMDDFDDETLATVNKFFENNLNVSETSRQLYIHRNTLVYRLDKLQKMTGLDLRNFDDAIIFKITLMVSKYMMYMDKMAY